METAFSTLENTTDTLFVKEDIVSKRIFTLNAGMNVFLSVCLIMYLDLGSWLYLTYRSKIPPSMCNPSTIYQHVMCNLVSLFLSNIAL